VARALFQYDDDDDEMKLAEQEQQQRQNYAVQSAAVTVPDKDGTISGMLADFSRSIGKPAVFSSRCVYCFCFSKPFFDETTRHLPGTLVFG